MILSHQFQELSRELYCAKISGRYIVRFISGDSPNGTQDKSVIEDVTFQNFEKLYKLVTSA